MNRDPDCIFCKIVAGEIPCHKVYEDEATLAFADIAPLNEGHCLVIPKAHSENLFQIPENDLAAVSRTVKKVAKALQKALGWPGLTVLQLNGRGANQVVMHYHTHLIPRDREQDGLDKLDWESSPGDQELVKAVAGKIRDALD